MSALANTGIARYIRAGQLTLLVFGSLSAIGGGVALVAFDGLGMPVSMLDGSPFDSFVAPGLVLLFVVGGTQTLGFLSDQRRWPSAPLWTAVAGFGMLIWIVVEIAIIQAFTALHGIYFSLGIIQLTLTIGALWLDNQRAPAPVTRPQLS